MTTGYRPPSFEWIPPVEKGEVELQKKKRQQAPFGFRGDWETYARETLGANYDAWKRSGQRLSQFLRGTRYGKRTAEVMGLEPEMGYDLEKLKPWFESLNRYRAYEYNYPNTLKRLQYWVRGAQLGLSPEAYLRIAQELDRGDRELTGIELYLFGKTEEAPEGYKPIPMGAPLEYAPAVAEPEAPRQSAQDWFAQTYPSIAGERGGARATQRGWRDIFTGRGRFAPKIKTIKF